LRLPYQRSTDDESSPIGTRFYIDQATVKPSPEGFKLNNPHIKMLVEGATQLKLPSFLAKKIDQVSESCELLHSFQHKGMPVSKIRCDNAGENKVLERTLKTAQWRMTNVEMEYTARDTPQQNSIAELGIWHTVLKAKTLMRATNVPMKFRYFLFPDAVKTAAKLDALHFTSIWALRKLGMNIFMVTYLPM
jgi:hypothetical protein